MKCLLPALLFGLFFSAVNSDELVSLLPPDGVPEGWTASGEHRIYEGAELYAHIDGGAELFNMHGFECLVLQDYTKGNLEVRVEIYDMGGPGGASGIFAANTVGLETGAEFGEGCSLDPLQIIFYRGRYYVSITCYEIKDELKEATAALAASVDKNICKTGK
jgi:hypothetical protein